MRVLEQWNTYINHILHELKLAVDFPESEGPGRLLSIFMEDGQEGTLMQTGISQNIVLKMRNCRIENQLYSCRQTWCKYRVTVEDVKDALRWVQERAKELNIIPDIFGFMGGSAGGHLSAVAAMSVPALKS